MGWETFGSPVAPVVLLLGLMLAGSSPNLLSKVGADPVGSLAPLLPTWFLVPVALVAVLGPVGGAVLDGSVQWSAVGLLVAGTVLGWGRWWRS